MNKTSEHKESTAVSVAEIIQNPLVVVQIPKAVQTDESRVAFDAIESPNKTHHDISIHNLGHKILILENKEGNGEKNDYLSDD